MVPKAREAAEAAKASEAPKQSGPTTATDAPYVYEHPVAVTTLASEALRQQLADHPVCQGLIVLGLNTENIGIEQIIEFCLTQPALKTIVVCGLDPTESCGHLPGQSFLALHQNGLDDHRRMIGAKGKRPVIKNISLAGVEHFRRTVALVDLINCCDVETITAAVAQAKANPPAPVPFTGPLKPDVPTYMAIGSDAIVQDPVGYLLIDMDYTTQRLTVTHFSNQGERLAEIHGPNHRALYQSLIEHGLVSRLDHAAYLGRELYRAEQAMVNHAPYVQDQWDQWDRA
ncbi:MAG: DUF4346 domain-containing protein [Cyanobacteria bacterium HKST-UBA03]|nr:DUF4346 domain-containing protein [Cyanobacteria bacterium HKST-UBA03]